MMITNKQILADLFNGVRSILESNDLADDLADFYLPDETLLCLEDALKTVSEEDAGMALANLPSDVKREIIERMEIENSLVDEGDEDEDA